MPENIISSSSEEYTAAAQLFSEYAAWLNIDLGFQHFEDELLTLSTMYAYPHGGIILTKEADAFVACVAIRKIDADIAELKRMFVQTAFQKKGIGKILLKDAIALAEKLGYKKIRLDTLRNMTPAINLYTANGFYEIPAYYYNPQKSAVYFEKVIKSG